MSKSSDVHTDAITQAESQLTDRDYTLLGWLYDHGMLTTPQIATALFPSRRFCQQRLYELMRLQVITRWRPFREGGGTYPYHYVLDRIGAELIAVQRADEIPRPEHTRKRLMRLINRANRAHLLGVNQFFTDLAAYARRHRAAQLRQWSPASRFHERGAFVEFDDNPAGALTPRPKPDGHGVWAEHGDAVAFFFEYDRGTESHTVLVDKVRRYATIGKEPLPVLFLLPSKEREYNLHTAMAYHRPKGAAVATASEQYLAEHGLNPAEAVWWRHARQGTRLRLSQLHSSSA